MVPTSVPCGEITTLRIARIHHRHSVAEDQRLGISVWSVFFLTYHTFIPIECTARIAWCTLNSARHEWLTAVLRGKTCAVLTEHNESLAYNYSQQGCLMRCNNIMNSGKTEHNEPFEHNYSQQGCLMRCNNTMSSCFAALRCKNTEQSLPKWRKAFLF